MKYNNYQDFQNYSQISIEELREKSKKNMKKGYSPVETKNARGAIATTWWGKSWCTNLERYADYSSRIGRGKRYVRNGAVIDLKIDEGLIKAKVQGSRSKPYQVEIKIDPLSEKSKKNIYKIAESSIDTLESLVLGEFPKELATIFTDKEIGLFPKPNEIHINCDCPDWAYLCKHAASTLYGVGVRLDEDPLMFFLLRSFDFNLLLQKSINEKKELMIKNIGKKGKRTIPKNKAKELFGI